MNAEAFKDKPAVPAGLFFLAGWVSFFFPTGESMYHEM
jgi:hypothetical protein